MGRNPHTLNPGYRSIDAEMSRHLTRCLQAFFKPFLDHVYPSSAVSALKVLDILQQHDGDAPDIILASLDVEAMYPSINEVEAVRIEVNYHIIT